jgi:hypothetical protein
LELIGVPIRGWSVGLHTAQSLGCGFHAAYRDIDDVVPSGYAVLQSSEKRALFVRGYWMCTGTLITDRFAEVERAENFARRSVSEPAKVHAAGVAAELNSDYGGKKTSKAEQFPQALGLGPADRNLGLLFIIHTQLVRALEPGDDFTDAVDVHQVGAVRAPKKIGV